MEHMRKVQERTSNIISGSLLSKKVDQQYCDCSALTRARYLNGDPATAIVTRAPEHCDSENSSNVVETLVN